MSIDIYPNVGDLVRQLQLAQTKADVAFLLNMDTLSDAAFDEQMNRLNFQRDALIRMGMPLSVWLSNGRLMKLATVAPDLWSRRTSTYQFDNEAIDKLIQELFIGTKDDVKAGGRDLSLVQILNRIIAAEDRLGRRSAIEKPKGNDPDVKIIAQSIRKLIAECDSGKSLEIALDLANLTRLDSDIRKARIRYPSLPFGNMYDALLDLAPSMSFILEGYKNHWFRRLLKGRKVSLIRFFYKVASGRVYQALAKSRKGPPLMTLSPEELDALAEADQLGGSYASFENALAAKQLIEWLLNNRETDGFVAIFTSKERELLRNLVSTGITEDSLQKMGIGKPEYLEMLPRLREKVAEYLGICPQ